MKKLLFILVCGLIAVSILQGRGDNNGVHSPLLPVANGQSLPATPITTEDGSLHDSSNMVSLCVDGKVENVPMDTYLFRVLAAEMPASFPSEAIKAQVVAARTYTMYKQKLYGDGGVRPAAHNGADLCSDYHHCKAYTTKSPEDMWGKDSVFYSEKLCGAIKDTDGEYITYNDQPIVAVFHSASGPRTENGTDVWGGNTPYLTSTESPGGEASPKYSGHTEVSSQDFAKKLTKGSFQGDPQNWIGSASRSSAGGILTVELGGASYKGTEIRQLFGLNSTNFILKYENGVFVFDTTGYGHGVGMSQYGARQLALDGADYQSILTWYYKGVTIEKAQEK